MTPEYVRPTTPAEAVALASAPGAVLLAGGTDALIWLKDGTCPIDVLVSLRDIPRLKGLQRDGGGWVLGAMTTHAWAAADPELRRIFPALAEACRTVGSPAVRTAATIGGNICTAAPSADSAGPLLAYGAEVLMIEPVGVTAADPGTPAERVLPLHQFFRGPGKTALAPGGLVVGLRLPDPGVHGAAFRKLSRRRAMDIAIVSATALVRLDRDGSCADLRLSLGAVAPTPLVVPGLAEVVRGRGCDAELLDEVAAAAVAACRPVSDIRASADYRRRMVGVLARAAVRDAWLRAEAAATTTSPERTTP